MDWGRAIGLLQPQCKRPSCVLKSVRWHRCTKSVARLGEAWLQARTLQDMGNLQAGASKMTVDQWIVPSHRLKKSDGPSYDTKATREGSVLIAHSTIPRQSHNMIQITLCKFEEPTSIFTIISSTHPPSILLGVILQKASTIITLCLSHPSRDYFV